MHVLAYILGTVCVIFSVGVLLADVYVVWVVVEMITENMISGLKWFLRFILFPIGLVISLLVVRYFIMFPIGFAIGCFSVGS